MPQLSDDALFDLRWARSARDMLGPLARLYGPVAAAAMEPRLREMLRAHASARPADLKALDLARDVVPDWFLSERMVGYVFYVDRFAGRLADVPARIPYLQDLGVTYVHMMPLLKPRPEPSDGGYAVMDYREVDPRLGTMADLEAACAAFRAAGISPCIDMVLNHTAAEHPWARAAVAGDAAARAFYRVFPDRTVPDAFEETLLEVFPDQAPSNFTHVEGLGWVWTTFNRYQWDLNWQNPEVFLAILDAILWLANRGVEVFRLDAVAFMWKRLGTICQNLPEVHDIIQGLVQAARIAAPATIFLSEAIVGPEDLVPYLGAGRHAGREANLAYHNSLMVQFWSSLAAGDARLARHVLASHFPERFERATWVTYLRCHDDIGWAITEEDAAAIPHTDGPGHRRFLTDFYAGRHPGSFARGADFQVNEATGDRRTNGALASLAGLEAALEAGEARDVELSVARILLGHALIAAWGGIPLVWMGDEIGHANDLSFLEDPARADDGRWMQRPAMDWARTLAPEGAAAAIQNGVRRILARRRATPELAGSVPTRVLWPDDRCVLAVARPGQGATLTATFNFAPEPRAASLASLGLDPSLAYGCTLAEAPAPVEAGRLVLPSYGAVWLLPA